MDKILIEGGIPLKGTVSASGAKNSALPLLFSSLLCPGLHRFENVPQLKDVESAGLLLKSLGCEFSQKDSLVEVLVPERNSTTAHYDLVRKMRASILCLGPLLSRFGEAVVSLPGGCAIGTRPIDLHLEAMKAMGAEIEIRDGSVHARATRLKGCSFVFETSTVGGTENMLMAAVLAEGATTIENAAKEPEIVDLAESLIQMGAQISGHGSGVIRIQGVKSLRPALHRVIPDRIEAGTLLLAGAITAGDVTVENCRPDHLEALVFKLKEAGFETESTPNRLRVKTLKIPRAVDITTQAYPLFPTDLQAQWMALMSVADGTSVISETVFENRFMHVLELSRMGADISPRSRVAIVRGRPGGLTGAPVMATDLRASACLVLAGLAAKGQTFVNRIYHLDRGYEGLETKLRSLGARIQRL